MFNQQKQQTEAERLDRLGQEALRAISMSEAEIATVADAEDLYARLRQRIAVAERQRADGRVQASSWWASLPTKLNGLSAWRRPWWPLAVGVTLLVLLAMIVPRWLQMPVPEPIVSYPPSPPVRPSVRPSVGIISPAPESSHSAQSQGGQKSTSAVTLASALKSERRPVRPRNWRGNVLEPESATEFIPLMYWPDASTLESGRVVRIKVPRATLVSFGLPMNAERAGELVKAEVVLGDDGLARAIRFIY